MHAETPEDLTVPAMTVVGVTMTGACTQHVSHSE